ncbi:MAG: hypothetical protein ACI8W7_004001 [Gammaproteobacteria bacterium]|jgi:hypothetical protein
MVNLTRWGANQKGVEITATFARQACGGDRYGHEILCAAPFAGIGVGLVGLRAAMCSALEFATIEKNLSLLIGAAAPSR